MEVGVVIVVGPLVIVIESVEPLAVVELAVKVAREFVE